MADLQAALIKQVNFYFSDANIARDNFLKEKIAEHPEGFVPLATLLTFKRLASLTMDVDVLINALKNSDQLVVDDGKKAVRRKSAMPESIQMDKQTIYAKGIPTTASLEELEAFFGLQGKVLAVWQRRYGGSDSPLKPSVFVVFDNEELVAKLTASPPTFTDQAVPLLISSKNDYLQRKAAEAAVNNANKATTSAAKQADAPKSAPMPKGASYSVSGVGEFERFSAVKSLWESDDQKHIRYVFLPSQDVAHIIFQDAEVGKKMVADADAKGTSINGKLPKIEQLEGEAEETLLANVEKEISDRAASNQANNGRGRGGRGGRGGGRGGRGGGRGRGQKRNRD